MKKGTTLIVLFGAVMFLTGYGLSQFFGYAKIARIVEPSAPLLKDALSEMSEQEMKDTLAQIRQNVGRIVQEADLQALFEALAASQALAARKRGRRTCRMVISGATHHSISHALRIPRHANRRLEGRGGQFVSKHRQPR